MLRYLKALVLSGLLLLALPLTAAASVPIGPDAEADSLLDLDPFTLNLIFAVVLPALVGLATKASTSPRVKAVLLALGSAVAGVVTVTSTGGAAISEASVKAAFLQFVTAVAVHFGLLKPTGTTAKLQTTGNKD